jgi:hypothetical protein
LPSNFDAGRPAAAAFKGFVLVVVLVLGSDPKTEDENEEEDEGIA